MIRWLGTANILIAAAVATPASADVDRTQHYKVDVETVASGLDSPWGLVFLPDGRLLVSERPGRLRIVDKSGAVSEAIKGLTPIADGGQGGLLGLAIDPDFARNRRVYYCHSEPGFLRRSRTSVARARLSDDMSKLENVKVIFQQEPSGSGRSHFGCRLVFDRTGALFVTTGDRGNMQKEVQKPDTHIGKIIRITTDGAPAPGNPKNKGWRPEIWSIGHRNAQGAVLHPETGELWTVEHGAAGGDEVNIPRKGRNYGWPVISYGRKYSGGKIGIGTEKAGMEQPVHYWDPSIAPSGLEIYTGDKFLAWKGSVFVGALAGQHLARLQMDGEKVIGEEQLLAGLGERIRAVRQGPDGYLYVLTDSSNGRVLRLKPAG